MSIADKYQRYICPLAKLKTEISEFKTLITLSNRDKKIAEYGIRQKKSIYANTEKIRGLNKNIEMYSKIIKSLTIKYNNLVILNRREDEKIKWQKTY